MKQGLTPRFSPPTDLPPVRHQAVLSDELGASPRATTPSLPRISPLLLKGFVWYSRRYLRRHFHSLRLSRSGWQPQLSPVPMVVYSSHTSWWDPLVGLVLQDILLPGSRVYSPIDLRMLECYKMFGRLGFFGVEQGSSRGAACFLQVSKAVLKTPGNILAVTPQGRFVDARERPINFQGGLGHLASRVGPVDFFPMAVEYVFWEERLPEVLVRFGQPVRVAGGQVGRLSPAAWTLRFESEMTRVQDALAAEAQARRTADFRDLLRGERGVSPVYDMWRRFRALLRGQSFTSGHGSK